MLWRAQSRAKNLGKTVFVTACIASCFTLQDNLQLFLLLTGTKSNRRYFFSTSTSKLMPLDLKTRPFLWTYASSCWWHPWFSLIKMTSNHTYSIIIILCACTRIYLSSFSVDFPPLLFTGLSYRHHSKQSHVFSRQTTSQGEIRLEEHCIIVLTLPIIAHLSTCS